MSDDNPTSSVNPQDELTRINEIAKEEKDPNVAAINTSVQPEIKNVDVDHPPAVQPSFQQETKTETNNTPSNLPLGDNNKSSKTLIIIAVVFFVLSLAGIGLYYMGIKKVSKETTEIPTPIPTEVSTPTATANPTENWKTYTSPEKFSFKYPLEAKVQEDNNLVSLSIWGPTQKEGTEFYDGISLSFKIGTLPKGKTLKIVADDSLKTQTQSGDVKILENVLPYKMGNLEGYSFTTEGLGKWISIYLQDPLKDSSYVEITEMVADPTKKGFEEAKDLILSTFIFLQSTATPSASPTSSPSASPTATP